MRTKAATGRWWLLLLGCCLVASVEAKKKKKKGSSKYSKQEIADFIESSAVGEIRKQGCADEADACISNQKCLEEFIAATRSERPSNPCPLLKAVRDCGDTAIQKVKAAKDAFRKQIGDKYPSFEEAGMLYKKAKEAENLVQRRTDYRTKQVDAEYLIKSAVVHADALEAYAKMPANEDIEEVAWREVFDQLREFEPGLRNEYERLLKLPQVSEKAVEKERRRSRKAKAKLKEQMEQAKAAITTDKKDEI